MVAHISMGLFDRISGVRQIKRYFEDVAKECTLPGFLMDFSQYSNRNVVAASSPRSAPA